VVAALAKCFPSGTARTAIEGWHDDWHGCVYIDLPTGQVSWHFHDSHAHLFADLPSYPKPWDGHDTDEKYRRLDAIGAAVAALAREYAEERVREEREAICALLKDYAVNLGGDGKTKPLVKDGRGISDVVRQSYIAAIRARKGATDA
jgi:hypothetical protein